VRLGGGAKAFLDGTWIRGENEDNRFDEPIYQMPAPEATLGVERRVDTGWQGRAAVRAVDIQDRVADQEGRRECLTTPSPTSRRVSGA
jgi:hemoglobin/transferrin/lactoferrin receptor protein